MVAAGGDEQDVAGRPPAGDVARLGDDVEAEDADVEVLHAVDVGGAQVDVADAHAGVDGARRRLDRLDAALLASAHGAMIGLPSWIGMRLSVLDQSPIPEGSTGAQALRNTLDLARAADRLGYHRYWVAEHHGGGMLAGPGARRC